MVAKALDKSSYRDQIKELVSGHCRGIDLVAERWARGNNIPIKVFPADWNQYGKSAGPIRNQQMVDYADALIAIPHPTEKSKGTWCIVGQMRKAGKPFFVYKVQEDFIVTRLV